MTCSRRWIVWLDRAGAMFAGLVMAFALIVLMAPHLFYR
jgi:hypothetical protein